MLGLGRICPGMSRNPAHSIIRCHFASLVDSTVTIFWSEVKRFMVYKAWAKSTFVGWWWLQIKGSKEFNCDVTMQVADTWGPLVRPTHGQFNPLTLIYSSLRWGADPSVSTSRNTLDKSLKYSILLFNFFAWPYNAPHKQKSWVRSHCLWPVAWIRL